MTNLRTAIDRLRHATDDELVRLATALPSYRALLTACRAEGYVPTLPVVRLRANASLASCLRQVATEQLTERLRADGVHVWTGQVAS